MAAYEKTARFDLKTNGQGGATAHLDLLLSRRDALKLGAAMAASCGVAHSHQGIIGSDLRPPGSAELKNEVRGPMGELPPVFPIPQQVDFPGAPFVLDDETTLLLPPHPFRKRPLPGPLPCYGHERPIRF
jgi:hypothetical protein